MKNEFEPTSEFVIRKPYLNYNNKTLEMEYLNTIMRQESFQEALYYASPDLHAELLKYLDGNLSEKKAQRMIATIYKYAQRIHYRCTPFGMFASCGIGMYSNQTLIPKSNGLRLHYRYDCQLLYDYIRFILKNASPDLLRAISICRNQTLLSNGCYYKLSVRNESGSIINIRIKNSNLLNFILSKSKTEITIDNLISECLNSYDISESDLYAYIKKLICNDILISNLQVETICHDNFTRILGILRDIDIPLLENFNQTLSILQSNASFTKKMNAIDSLYVLIRDAGINVKKNQIVQVDAYNEDAVIIDKSVKDSLSEWFHLLLTINTPSGNPLANFITRFNSRYEEMTLSLLNVLDKESGIGYMPGFPNNSNLIDSIFSSPGLQQNKPMNKTFTLSIIEQIILKKIIDCGSFAISKIPLTEKDFKKYNKADNYDYPLSFSCMFSIVGYNENGPILNGVHFSGPSATCLLTRFSDGHNGIKKIVEDIGNLEQQQNEDVMLAEISHLSRPHTGNVQMRPDFRNYDIPYLSFAHHGNESIDISDINVRISHGKIKLYSQSQSKEIIPCFSSAFNYKMGTSDLYQFLAEVQQQNSTRILMTRVDSLLVMLGHVPRITYKNIIVSPESWLIDNSWGKLKSPQSTEHFKSLHEELKMPRYLSYNQGDNYFIIDSQSDLSINEFFNLSKNLRKITLKEFMPLADDIKHYNYVMEIIQPFIHK